MQRIHLTLWCSVACSALLTAQTAIDLRGQSKNVDFSNAVATKPMKAGVILPAICSTGEMFLRLNGLASGSSVYACTAPNVWTLQSGGSTADLHSGNGVNVIGNTIAIEDAVIPLYHVGTGAPSIVCQTGRDFYVDSAAGALYYCAAGVWRQVPRSDTTIPVQFGGTGANLAATGGAGKYLKQTTPGGNVSVEGIGVSDLPMHTHYASDLAAGVLTLQRGGTNQVSWIAGRCVQVSADGTRIESAASACGGAAGGTGTQQITVTNWSVPSGVGFFALGGTTAASEATSGRIRWTPARSGSFRSIRASQLTTAPAPVTFTIMELTGVSSGSTTAAPTSLSCTIAANETSCNFDSAVQFAPGQAFAVKVDNTAGTSLSYVNLGVVIDWN